MSVIRTITFSLALLVPAVSFAQSPDDVQIAQNRSYEDVVADLEYSGYLIASVTRTLFGRIKITATNQSHAREVIVSRTTGEILSDTIVTIFDTSEESGGLDVGISGSVTIGINRKSGL